jgi:16S rRNA (guanine527-N7)-methyltransferase
MSAARPPATDAKDDDAGSGAGARAARREEERPTRTREPLPAHVRDLPPLGPGYEAVVRDGISALGLELDADVRDRIDDHLRLLLAWTTAINLTAVRDPVAAGRLHVLDSLSAVPLLRALGADRLLDLGSGGGYPGLPLASATPARALLVESVAKKARFLEAAVEAVGLGDTVTIGAVRAESLARLGEHREAWPVVTARAVGDLAEVVELAFPLLRPGGSLVAWKRGDLTAETDAAERAMRSLGGGRLAVHDVAIEGLSRHRLVVATKRGSTPAAFPRDPARRRRRPW